MDYVINKILEIVQKTFLNSEITGEIIFPFILLVLTTIGADKPNFDFQKESSKIFSIINFLIFNYRQYAISGYHELLNTIPHLNDIIGPIDLETRLQIQAIEKKKNHSNNLKIIGKYQIIIEKIFGVIETYLNISKNHPHILRNPEIHSFLKDILLEGESNQESKNSFNLDEELIPGLTSMDFYADYNQSINTLKIYFKINGFQKFPSEILTKESFLESDEIPSSQGQMSKLILNIYNSGFSEEGESSSEKKKVKDKIKEILFGLRHQIGRQTRIFMGGHSLEGCLPILMVLDPEIQNILCQCDVSGENVFILSVGTPAFCDPDTREQFRLLNYNYYHFISMRDPISFQKLKPWCQLGMPTILGHPNKVNEFFSKFYGNELNSEQDKNSKLDYVEQINNIFKNHFQIDDDFENYEPENEHNCFLTLPMYTNVSFELTHKYE